MLGKRILTAFVGIPIAAYVINYGEWLFAITVLVLTLLAWYEFYTILKNKGIKVFYSLGILSNVFILGSVWLGNSQEILIVIFVSTVLFLLKIVTSATKFTVVDAACSLLGISYIGISFAHLLLLRSTDSSLYLMTAWGELSTGAAYVWLAFVSTWASDTCAFFIGSYCGKHKLCPKISPNKTIEGALGGMLGSSIAMVAMGILFKLPLGHSVMMGMLVGIVAPVGDLVESALKRFANVKDSGQILPGHGGILDRFDSILFTVPFIYYYLYVFVLR